MPKYLISANYTEEGLQGLLAKGGSDRVTAVKAAAKLSTTPLLTPEEIDEATKAKKLIYRPPGK